MKVLVIGNGGREHAIAWKIAQSPLVHKIYCAPGNGGTALEKKCINLNINKNEEILKFAKENDINITIVGPEVPLVDGIVDMFKEASLKIFGPSKEAAALEGSKAYAKNFMKKYGIKTAAYEVFENASGSIEYLKSCSYPIVIKADGLAAGKGVAICQSFEEAKTCIESFMIEDVFEGAGSKVVIEEFLEGVEASILAITDGETMIPFLSAKDHKTIYEDNKGPNTGGMGVISPNPYCTNEVLESFIENIMNPTLKGFSEENMDYIGIVFFGIMITKKGVYLLEYNVRMGDPETEAVLPLMESDFMELIMCALNKSLNNYKITWKDKHSCCVVAASGGYPAKYETGFEINGVNDTEGKVFIAGAKFEENALLTSGGRVLCVTASGDTLEEARSNAYNEIKKVNFEGMYYRKDIGKV
ncbi:phosphoribosylamine--glycine ligase/phosphoribosylformylglycinamidine synthase [Clostridium pascui]|uniref:phosphoribosylamine--glycine ligase n=1 Tax=Clostridium pascui TaxID=46609 RepID=UPI001959BB80|nr:phosphoribosylamine--glycine ligase [Clostridium pascui]MBM7870882.1 phosphoribosylamine--glycine ligase/phosphoribosylformylglycinamidine synthase [Clostridium pascui]